MTEKKVLKGRLVCLKILHTFVWAAFVLMIAYTFYSGVSNRIKRSTFYSILAVFFEGVLLLAFQWKCPITLVAHKYTEEHGPGFDIFLPPFLARYNKVIFTLFYLLSVMIVMMRALFL